jgi:uncharacterized protein (DUF1330 family)
MIDRRTFALLAAGLIVATACAAAWSADAPPAKAYVVGEMTVKDAAGYRAYVDAAAPIIRKYGGTFLVRGGQTVAVEGAPPARIVIIEFASLDAAKRFENSPEYTAIAPMRQKAADSRLYLAEGTVTPP